MQGKISKEVEEFRKVHLEISQFIDKISKVNVSDNSEPVHLKQMVQ